MVSHETVDSKGQIVRIKVKKELASMVDIIKHKAAKRAAARNMFRSLAKVDKLEPSEKTS